MVPECSQQEGRTLSLPAEGVISMLSHMLEGTWHGGCGNTEDKVASRTLA